MNFPYIAEPPQPIKRNEFRRHLGHLLVSLRFVIWQVLVPFRSGPEEVPAIPEPQNEIDDKQLDQCHFLFEQAEKRRTHLEQKAQSTFGLMTFLVPLLASLAVFLISKTAGINTLSRPILLALLAVAAALLLLGFVSAVRAVAVKSNQALYLQSVIDEMGQVRKFDKLFRLRGLLWCTAMNEAMNDHLAQFVKGAQLLTAGAVIVVAVASIPAAIMLYHVPAGPTTTKIVGTVEVGSSELATVKAELPIIRREVEGLAKGKASQDQILALQNRVAQLEARLATPKKRSPGKAP